MNESVSLVNYDDVAAVLGQLDTAIPTSEVHGTMCAYLSVNAVEQCQSFVQSLCLKANHHVASMAQKLLFDVMNVSQHQIHNMDFKFQLLLPDDTDHLLDRAKAFGEWCLGFSTTLQSLGISTIHVHSEEAKDCLHHIEEFSKVDYEELHIDEDEEKALFDVTEYTRVAILALYYELLKTDVAEKNKQLVH